MEQHPLTEYPVDDGAGEAKSAAGVIWDLGILFKSVDDPQIDATLKSASDRVEVFEKKYRGTLNVAGGPSAQHLLAALREAEAIQEQLVAVDAYASLTYAA
ncbi:MAG TPA: hypothetical protein VGK81_04150, partial [Anaerolineae bacterium]